MDCKISTIYPRRINKCFSYNFLNVIGIEYARRLIRRKWCGIKKKSDHIKIRPLLVDTGFGWYNLMLSRISILEQRQLLLVMEFPTKEHAFRLSLVSSANVCDGQLVHLLNSLCKCPHLITFTDIFVAQLIVANRSLAWGYFAVQDVFWDMDIHPMHMAKASLPELFGLRLHGGGQRTRRSVFWRFVSRRYGEEPAYIETIQYSLLFGVYCTNFATECLMMQA